MNYDLSAFDCKHPGTIDNGRVIVVNGSTLFSGAAEYHCLPQFERIGPFLRKCLDTGLWSGEEPKCESEWISPDLRLGGKGGGTEGIVTIKLHDSGYEMLTITCDYTHDEWNYYPIMTTDKK